MSVAVGLKTRDAVYIGADSMESDGFVRIISKIPKIFRLGKIIIAGTGSSRVLQLISSLTIEQVRNGQDERLYLNNTLVPEIMRILSEAGSMTRGDQEHLMDAYFLIGIRGRLFILDCDFHLIEPADNIAAIGSGEQVSYGALEAFALSKEIYDSDPEEATQILNDVMGIVARRTPFIGGPFVCLAA